MVRLTLIGVMHRDGVAYFEGCFWSGCFSCSSGVTQLLSVRDFDLNAHFLDVLEFEFSRMWDLEWSRDLSTDL